MNGRFTGKAVVVTGATSGIGRAAALLFAAEGACVVIAGRREEQGSQVVRQIRQSGGEATFTKTDVRDPASVENMVRTCVHRFGRLDIAFNNSGTSGVRPCPLAEQTPEEWHEVISTNLTGVWLSMKFEIAAMLERGGGVIVNNASIFALVGSAAGVAPYVASKHGILGLTRAAALEYAKSGMRVNCVCPGMTLSEMTQPAIELQAERFNVAIQQNVPLGRVAAADEIARAVLWLCSDEASFVTGQSLCVDGGWVAR